MERYILDKRNSSDFDQIQVLFFFPFYLNFVTFHKKIAGQISKLFYAENEDIRGRKILFLFGKVLRRFSNGKYM